MKTTYFPNEHRWETSEEKGLLYAWMAGFVDGEGTITICSMAKSKRFTIKLAVCNTKREALEVFEREFGGKVRTRNWGTKAGRENWNTCYEWMLTSRQAIKAIILLQPYLKLKHRQARICVRLYFAKIKRPPVHRRWDKPYNIKLTHLEEKAKAMIAKLNKRGVL